MTDRQLLGSFPGLWMLRDFPIIINQYKHGGYYTYNLL